MKLRFLVLTFLVLGIVYNVTAQPSTLKIFTTDVQSSALLDSVVINIYNVDNRGLETNTVSDSTGIIFISVSGGQKYLIEAIRKDYVKRILSIKAEDMVEGDTLQVLVEMVSLNSEIKNKNQRLVVKDVSGQKDKPELSKSSLTTENEVTNTKFSKINGSEGFTGYRIVIHFSRFPIPKDHILYYTHDEVIEFETMSNHYLYMIEGYETLQEATEGHLENYKEEYPLSYIIGFDKGIRIK